MYRVQKAMDTATVTAGSLAATTWIADLNAVLQLGATVVAILAGLASIIWHYERIRELKAQRIEQ